MISRTFKMRAKLLGLDRCPARLTIASRQAAAEMKKSARPKGAPEMKSGVSGREERAISETETGGVELKGMNRQGNTFASGTVIASHSGDSMESRRYRKPFSGRR
jgi:hypothetical protein